MHAYSHQGALLCLGQLGGHEILDRCQHSNDGGSNQGTDSQEVVEQDHSHNDLRRERQTGTFCHTTQQLCVECSCVVHVSMLTTRPVPGR